MWKKHKLRYSAFGFGNLSMQGNIELTLCENKIGRNDVSLAWKQKFLDIFFKVAKRKTLDQITFPPTPSPRNPSISHN